MVRIAPGIALRYAVSKPLRSDLTDQGSLGSDVIYIVDFGSRGRRRIPIHKVLGLIWALGCGSNDGELLIPFRQTRFTKEPLDFLVINPPSKPGVSKS
jgi:hypothetical protein